MILVVDDDELIRKSLRRLLNFEGYQVETANDGSDALKKLETLAPKVILLDMKMLPMDGPTFIQNLVQTGKDKNYTIIVMTAMVDMLDELRDLYRRGVIHDFVIKPFVFPERLLQEIQRFEAQS